MYLLTQTDKKWNNQKLGKSKWTIGDSGCVITSLCNIHNLNGNDITPDELNRQLTEINGYTKDGDLYWNSAEKILKCKINPFAWKKETNNISDMNNILCQKINQSHHIICRYMNKNVNHFSNILNVFYNIVVVFDVYSGKIICLPKSDINRLVIVDYNN